MHRGFLVKAVSALLILAYFCGCASSTKITVNVIEPDGKPITDATVVIDGKNIGQTPNASKRVSNFVGRKTEIRVSKDGYDTVKTEAVKEVKAANVVLGVLLNFMAWMWVYGPTSHQDVILTPGPAVE